MLVNNHVPEHTVRSASWVHETPLGLLRVALLLIVTVIMAMIVCSRSREFGVEVEVLFVSVALPRLVRESVLTAPLLVQPDGIACCNLQERSSRYVDSRAS
jgi:uncharacterized membrane protein